MDEETYSSDVMWSFYAPAASDALETIQAYTAYLRAHGPEAGPAQDGARDGLPLQSRDGLAMIPIMGPMMRRGGPLACMFGLASTDAIRSAVQAADADPDVQEIILRVDSPGGSVSGLREAADTIDAVETPIIAQVEGMATSAAYYLVSQADEIRMGPTDLVGSIGTRMMLLDASKMFEQEGLEAVVIDTGQYKSAGALGTEITQEQRADFQRLVDGFMNDFVAGVARGRNMTEGAVREVGDGRMFFADEARQLGLADSVSTLQDTMRERRARVQTRRSTQAARARLKVC